MVKRSSLLLLILAWNLAPAAEPATISGTITDTDTGLPIAGATVVFGAGGFLEANMTVTETAADGSYTLSIDMAGQPSRSGFVEAAGPNHAPQRLGGQPLWDCHFVCGGGGPAEGLIELNAGETLGNQDFSLAAGGRVSGTVSASGGAPLGGIFLSLWSANTRNAYTDHFQAISAVDGSWEMPLAVRPGDDFRMLAGAPFGANYVIQAWNNRSCQYRSCAIVSADPLPIVAGVLTPGIDFILQPGATISGTLLPDDELRHVVLFDAAGGQMPGAIFILEPGQSSWQFERLAGGSYYLQVGPPAGGESNLIRQLHNGLPCPPFGCDRARGTPLTVPVGGHRDGVNITLSGGGSIAARIVDAATGLTPDVLIQPGNPTFFGALNFIDTTGEVVGGGPVREVGGELRMLPSAGIPPGSYYVRTHNSWWGTGLSYNHPLSSQLSLLDRYSDAIFPNVPCAGLSCDLSSANLVEVVEGEVTEIVIEMSKGSMLSGQVVDDGTGAGIAATVVELVDAGNRRLAATRTDGDGQFSFGAFPPGSYYLRTAMAGLLGLGNLPAQHAYFDRVFGATSSCSEQLCDPATGTAIALDGNDDADGFILRVQPGPVIRGRLIDSLSGLDINFGFVDVFTEGGTLVGRFRVNWQTGLYQTTALPPGTYTLVPRVSPAFVAVPLTGEPESRLAPLRSARTGAAGGFTVEMGTEDVEVALGVVDLAQATIFGDRFDESGISN